MLDRSLAVMHFREIDASNEAAACLAWEEFSLEVMTAISLAFAMFERLLLFPGLEIGMGYQGTVRRRMFYILHLLLQTLSSCSRIQGEPPRIKVSAAISAF